MLLPAWKFPFPYPVSRLLLAGFTGACLLTMSNAQRPGFNYDENKVPQYTLPNPLLMQNGASVTTAAQWTDKRRPEILELFEDQMYGRLPACHGSQHPPGG